ncbi:hypothetical protein SCALM49S_06237 [Streptomyces californicus]
MVPGFVDMHNHGGGGASFTSGTADEVLTGIRTHREHGTTTMVASTVTGEMDFLARRAGELSELVEQGDLAHMISRAPFISPCPRKGAHSEQLLRYPDPAEVRKLVDAARGAARMVTLATELPGGLDSVRLLADWASSQRSATRTPPTRRPSRRSTRAPPSRRTCSTRCRRSPTASRARSPRSWRTTGSPSS